MEYLTREKEYDWVYLVVSPKNPIKTTISADTAEDRYQAAIAAVKRHPELHVWVDDIELKMPPPQYTIKTLDALRQREPENDFTFVMGADNLENIHRWRDFQRILSDYGVAVYPRKGYDHEAIKRKLIEECRHFPAPYVLDANEFAEEGQRSLEETLRDTYNIEIIDAPIVDISSTEIREGLAEGRDMSEWLM
jgi:nicotinate-nucleotide adenylyltransferase